MKLAKYLIKEYGEQTYRDAKVRNHGKGTKSIKKLNAAAEISAYVAWSCGYISEKQIPTFCKIVVDYAKKTTFPKDFC